MFFVGFGGLRGLGRGEEGGGGGSWKDGVFCLLLMIEGGKNWGDEKGERERRYGLCFYSFFLGELGMGMKGEIVCVCVVLCCV